MVFCFWRIFLLFLYFGGVTAPRCFVCNSLSEPACGNAFMLQQTDRKYIERCSTSCYSFLAQKDDNMVLSRGCLPGIKTIPRCIFDEKDGLYGVMCTCNSNFCNVTSGLKSSIFTLVSGLVLSLYVWRGSRNKMRQRFL